MRWRAQHREISVVAVVRDAVVAVGVVIHQAKIELAARSSLRYPSQVIQTFWNETPLAPVSVRLDRFSPFGGKKSTVGSENGGLIDAENRRPARCVDCCFDGPAFDAVFDAIEE
jgi:hypothetical protein